MGVLNLGDPIGAYFDYKAGEQQGAALTQAQSAYSKDARKNRQLQEQMMAAFRSLMAEGAPTRKLQYGATKYGLEGLTSASTAQPGTSPQFQRSLEGGLRGLSSGLAAYGVSPDSSVFARSSGELAGSLTAADQQQIFSILQFLSGQAPNMMPYAMNAGQIGQGYGGLASQGIGNMAQTMIQGGAVRAGTTSAIGDRFSNLGYSQNGSSGGGEDMAQVMSLMKLFGLG